MKKKTLVIEIEIFRREIDHKMYLGLKAALKNYRVIIGSREHLFWLIKNEVIRDSIYLMKSIGELNIERIRILNKKNYLSNFDVEASITEHNLERYFSHRSSKETVSRMEYIFCWGNEDYKHWKKKYPMYKKKIINSGSISSTLWNKKFKNYYDYECKINKKKYKKYVLIVSNFNKIFNNNSITDIIRGEKKIPGRFLNTKEEKLRIKALKDEIKLFRAFCLFIEKIAKENPKINFVIRLHPSEKLNKWKLKVRNKKNIIYNNTRSLGSLLRSSLCSIHNGCTSGFEAYLSGVPALIFSPFKLYRQKSQSNILGHKIKSSKDFKDIFNSSLYLKKRQKWFFNKKKDNFINQKIKNIKLGDPADKVLFAFNKLKVDKTNLNIEKITFQKNIKIKVKKILKKYGIINLKYHEIKFPDIEMDEIHKIKSNLSKLNAGFRKCKIQKFLGNTFIIER